MKQVPIYRWRLCVSHLEWLGYVCLIACVWRLEDYSEVLGSVSELFVAAFASANKIFKGLID